MLAKIFAILILSHFAVSEIYIGQNPQNVSTTIMDSNGNLIPVQGVADEIIVLNLNYGEGAQNSGISIDLSVSPVNGSSSMGAGYESSISAPSQAESSSSFPSQPFLSQFSAPPNNPTNEGNSGMELPSKSPVNQYDHLVEGMNGGTNGFPWKIPNANVPQSATTNKAPTKGPNFLQTLTNFLQPPKINRPPKRPARFPFAPPFGTFVALGGDLGPELDNSTGNTLNNTTPGIAAVPLSSTITGGPINLTPVGSSPGTFNFSQHSPSATQQIPFTRNNTWNFISPISNVSTNNVSSSISTPQLTNLVNSIFNSNGTTMLQPMNSSPISNGFLGSFNRSTSPLNTNKPNIPNFMNPNSAPLPGFFGSMLNNNSLWFNAPKTNPPAFTNFSNQNPAAFANLLGLWLNNTPFNSPNITATPFLNFINPPKQFKPTDANTPFPNFFKTPNIAPNVDFTPFPNPFNPPNGNPMLRNQPNLNMPPFTNYTNFTSHFTTFLSPLLNIGASLFNTTNANSPRIANLTMPFNLQLMNATSSPFTGVLNAFLKGFSTMYGRSNPFSLQSMMNANSAPFDDFLNSFLESTSALFNTSSKTIPLMMNSTSIFNPGLSLGNFNASQLSNPGLTEAIRNSMNMTNTSAANMLNSFLNGTSNFFNPLNINA